MFTKKKFLGAALLLPVALVAAGCASGDAESASDSSGEPIVVANARGITTFDGDQCFNASGMAILYDSLLRISDDGQGLVPGIAESYEYDEDTYTYTFTIRDDAGFSSGEPVTADDVAFSMNEWVAGPVSGSYYSKISEVSVVDDQTVSVVMAGPDSFLLPMLTWCTSTIVPEDYAGMTKEEYLESPITAGPYSVESVSDFGGPSESVVFVKNENWYGADDGLPMTDTLEMRLISDANQRTLQFESGEVDIIQDIDPATVSQLDPDVVQYSDAAAIKHLILNAGAEPLSDPDLRQAISLALDRDELVAALDENATAATGILPNNLPNIVEPDEPYETDLEAAKDLVAASGYPDGVTVSLLYPSGDEIVSTIVQVVQAQLAEIGVEVELEAADAATVSSRRVDSDFDMVYMSMAAISPSPFDPISLLPYSRYPSAGGDITVSLEQLDVGTSAVDAEAQQAAVKAVQNDGIEQAVLIGLVQTLTADAVSESIEGYEPLQYSSIFYPETLTK